MIDEYLNFGEETPETLRARIVQLENELEVIKSEYEITIQKYMEIYSNIEEKVKERSNKLKEVQHRLEQKTRELDQERITLKNSEQRFKDLFQSSPEPILVLGSQHKIIGINPTATILYNTEKRNLIGATPYFFAPENEKEKQYKTYEKIISCRQSYIETSLWTSEQNSIPVEISSSRIQYLGQQANVLYIHDISNRIESEKRIRDAMATINEYNQKLEIMLEDRTKKLIQTERHAAFSLLIQGLVHNLRNPLNIVSGGAQMILMVKKTLEEKNTLIPEELRKPAEIAWKNANSILAATEKLVKIIDSMMAKSKSDNTDEMEQVDLNEILSQELDFWESDAQFKHRVKKSIFLINEKLNINIVPSELSQVFQNLVRNALDAMYYQQDSELEIKTGKTGKEVWFSIQDNGPGISNENQAKIFDPFFSTKLNAKENKFDKPSGTGLGLHICSEMVNAYNGRIELESKENSGAKFTIYFPELSNH